MEIHFIVWNWFQAHGYLKIHPQNHYGSFKTGLWQVYMCFKIIKGMSVPFTMRGLWPHPTLDLRFLKYSLKYLSFADWSLVSCIIIKSHGFALDRILSDCCWDGSFGKQTENARCTGYHKLLSSSLCMIKRISKSYYWMEWNAMCRIFKPQHWNSQKICFVEFELYNSPCAWFVLEQSLSWSEYKTAAHSWVLCVFESHSSF